MLQPRPGYSPNTESYSDAPPPRHNGFEHDDTDTIAAFESQFSSNLQSYEVRYARRSIFARKAASAALLLTLFQGPYWADVSKNSIEENRAEPSITHSMDARDPANNSHAIINFQGFNASSADHFTQSIGPALQEAVDGRLYSVDYENALLNRQSLYESVIDLVEQDDITHVSFVGYSMGGDIAAEVATDVITKSDIPVDLIAMISSPDGDKTVREYQKGEMAFMQNLAKVPGILHSSIARYIGELYFFRDRYTQGTPSENAASLIETLPFVWQRYTNEQLTTTSFLNSQVGTLVSTNLEAEIQSIASQRYDKQMPTLLYLGTENPGYDIVVDDKESANNIREYATAAGLDFTAAFVPGANHSLYYESVDAYRQTFLDVSERINAQVNSQRIILQLGQLSLSQNGSATRYLRQ